MLRTVDKCLYVGVLAMSAKKFDNIDRKRVIRVAEEHFGVKLSKVGRRPKWLHDEAGRNYWVLGGYGDWHGIPEEMMDAEINAPLEGVLVVAVRRKASMEVFAGSVGELIEGKDKLYRAKKTTGDYQFTYKVRGTHLIVEQLPIFSLKKIRAMSYEADEKESDIAVDNVTKLFEKMSKEEQAEFLKSLREKEP